MMDPSFTPGSSSWAGQLGNVRLPPPQHDLRSIENILFVPHHGPCERLTPNILAAAALYRAVSLARLSEPSLHVIGEAQLANWANRRGSIGFLDALNAGSSTVLLTSASLYRRDFASLLGNFMLDGHVLIARPSLIANSIPLGKRSDEHAPVSPFVRELAGRNPDSIVLELLALSDGSHDGAAQGDLRHELPLALSALQARSGLFMRLNGVAPLDPSEVIATLIAQLATGSKSPDAFVDLCHDYRESSSIAEAIWESARQISSRVFQLEGIPFREQDSLVRSSLARIYRSDSMARYVLERNEDCPPNKLTLAEALRFQARLSADAKPGKLLRDVQRLLAERNDCSTVAHIQRARDRGRNPRDILVPILEAAQHIPDPDGVFTFLKSPEDINVEGLLDRAGIPMHEHGTLWTVNVNTGNARRMTVSFQAKYLSDVLAVLP